MSIEISQSYKINLDLHHKISVFILHDSKQSFPGGQNGRLYTTTTKKMDTGSF